MNIYLVRHGETDYNKERLLMGQLDIPLNDKGLSQAKQVGKVLENKGISKIYSSDLQRATKTAEIINTHNIPIELVTKFREQTLGRLDGTKWSPEWDELDINEFNDIILREGGEPFINFETRVWETFIKITENHPKDDNFLIITHGGCIRIIIMKILEATEEIFSNLSIDNCSLTKIVHIPQRKAHKYRINYINSNWFLE
ncbi:MAG: histidine phosphatase family protein [Candidatus Heimdallarchaeota archaeon]|nr:histidine phosphatase family protein [Candidatus Heimdallarchaeota archaeon]